MQVSRNFENNIKKYVAIDDKISSAQQVIRELRKEKEAAADQIMVYIKTHKLEDHPINITGGRINMGTSRTTAPMNRAYIEERLGEYFKSYSKAREVVEFLYSNRETVEKQVLKRTKNRS